MADLLAAARVYRHMVGARIRSELQYRASFVVFLGSQFLITMLDFVEIAVIFSRVDSLAGWSLAEVALLYGTTAFSFALADIFVSEIEMVHVRIRSGNFDSLLVRPVAPLLQIVADEFALRRIGKALQALVVLTGALVVCDVDWSAAKVGLFAVTLVSGAVIFSAFFVAGACIQFFTVDAGEFMNAFTYGGNFMAQYPMKVYGTWFRRFFVFIVPVAFVNYLPLLHILGRPQSDGLGLPAAARFASPAVAVAAAWVAAALWRFSVRHYRSTGS